MGKKRSVDLEITEEARGNVFDNCEIGNARILGSENKFKKTKIGNFRIEHASLWKGLVFAVVAAVVGGAMKAIIEFMFT